MQCCVCSSSEGEFIQCEFCNKLFCIICIEVERKKKQYLLSRDGVCIYCRIKGNFFVRDYRIK